jgi:hypothetical protein
LKRAKLHRNWWLTISNLRSPTISSCISQGAGIIRLIF